MRIAIAVEGTRGDVHPMLALGAAFRAAGHDVRLCGPPDFRQVTEAQGLDFHPVGRDVRAFLEEQSRALHEGALSTLREGARFFRENVGRHFAALDEATRDVDRIFGAGTQVAAASIAEARGVPYRFIAYCTCLFPSASHPPFVVPQQGLPGWMNRTAWRGMARVMNLALRGEVNRHRDALGLAPVADVVAHTYSPAPLLAVDAGLDRVPDDVRMQVEQIGCLHPFVEEPLPAKLRDFLEAGPPPVYLGFGSMTDPAPRETTRLVLEAVEAVGCRALLSEGWAGLGGLPLPEGVLEIGSVSHPALFRRVAAVVHHGGAGTTTTAARAGVPQVLLPHVLDQFYWARRVREMGLGPLAPRRDRLTAAGLADALHAVLGNEVVTERAAEVGARLRDELAARPDPARVLL